MNKVQPLAAPYLFGLDLICSWSAYGLTEGVMGAATNKIQESANSKGGLENRQRQELYWTPRPLG